MRGAALFLGLALLLAPGISANAGIHPGAPFAPGERFTYQATWGIVSAGRLVLEVLPFESVHGTRAWHFAMTTRTNEAVDLIYPVRERQESYVDIGLTRSLAWKKQAGGRHPRDVFVEFNWNDRTATRSNFGRKMEPVSIRPGTFDTLSLFYIIRLYNLREKESIEVPVSEGDNCIVVKAAVGKRERLRIGEKAYDAIPVTADMGGLESQKAVKKGDIQDLTIWFTDDDRKIPIKIKSKVRVGYFVFELTGSEP